MRDRIVAETRGNPLALLELPRGLTPAELAGGFGLPARPPLGGPHRGRASCGGSKRCPTETRRLLLVAAAEPVGDARCCWRAGGRARHRRRRRGPAAADAGLVELGARVRFRHPLVRSAVYRRPRPRTAGASHRALADATDPEAIPIAAPGTARRPRPGPTRTSPPSSSARPSGRRRAAGWPPRRAFLERAADADAGSGARGRGARWPRRRPSTRPARPTRPARCCREPRRAAGRAPARAASSSLRGADRVRRDARPRRAAAAARGGAGGSSRSTPALARDTYLDALCAQRSSAGRLARGGDAREVAGGRRAAPARDPARAPRSAPRRARARSSPTGYAAACAGARGGVARVPATSRAPRRTSCAGCGWPATSRSRPVGRRGLGRADRAPRRSSPVETGALTVLPSRWTTAPRRSCSAASSRVGDALAGRGRRRRRRRPAATSRYRRSRWPPGRAGGGRRRRWSRPAARTAPARRGAAGSSPPRGARGALQRPRPLRRGAGRGRARRRAPAELGVPCWRWPSSSRRRRAAASPSAPPAPLDAAGRGRRGDRDRLGARRRWPARARC